MQTSCSNVHFGGPDLKKYALRDILLDCINQTPASGIIHWICYYLNDRSILDALANAATRGVSITIFIEATPRIPEINRASIEYLRNHAPAQIKIILADKKPAWEYFGLHWRPHFHGKLYYFSHPNPHVLLGSYNPTAGADELSDQLLGEIGDHSISHNALVDISDNIAVSIFATYINSLHQRWFRSIARCTPSHNQTHHAGDWDINYLPRLRTHPIQRLLTKNDKPAVVKCAISHLKGPGIRRTLLNALRSGKEIEILLDSTQRRVSREHLSFLEQNNIRYYQPTLPPNCLMHNKFILCESENEASVTFGSYNWSARSRYLNHEIIASTSDGSIVSRFKQRWEKIVSAN